MMCWCMAQTSPQNKLINLTYMKTFIKTIRWNKDTILILTGAVLIGLALFSIKGEWEIFAGIIAAGITLAIGVSQTRLANDRMLKELFTEFNSRYDKINNELGRLGGSEDISQKKHVIVDYFNLCAEEYYWFKNRRIPPEIWDAWRSGIKSYTKNEIFREVADEEAAYDASYYGFFGNVWKKL